MKAATRNSQKYSRIFRPAKSSCRFSGSKNAGFFAVFPKLRRNGRELWGGPVNMKNSPASNGRCGFDLLGIGPGVVELRPPKVGRTGIFQLKVRHPLPLLPSVLELRYGHRWKAPSLPFPYCGSPYVSLDSIPSRKRSKHMP